MIILKGNRVRVHRDDCFNENFTREMETVNWVVTITERFGNNTFAIKESNYRIQRAWIQAVIDNHQPLQAEINSIEARSYNPYEVDVYSLKEEITELHTIIVGMYELLMNNN
jgi:hypothetical protein